MKNTKKSQSESSGNLEIDSKHLEKLVTKITTCNELQQNGLKSCNSRKHIFQKKKWYQDSWRNFVHDQLKAADYLK